VVYSSQEENGKMGLDIMVKTEIKRVVGYARISSDSQIENTSIPEQKERIEAYAKSQGWKLDRIFVDEGFTGSNDDRDGYKEMMEYIKDPDNEVSAIVVVKADRIHRRLKNLLILIEDVLEPNGIAFISVSEHFDTSTPQGMLFLQMIGSFAEFERSVINERTKGGRLATAKKNKYAGGQVPYGYEVINGEIQVIDNQAFVVKRIFQEFIDGKSYYKIAKLLNKEGVPTKTGKNWSPQTVKNVVHTETYTGFNTYDGEKEQNGIKQKGVFPRIISRQMWHKAQSRLNERDNENE
jgi:DNA invertase Pin-like site-specific DNA recombinase